MEEFEGVSLEWNVRHILMEDNILRKNGYLEEILPLERITIRSGRLPPQTPRYREHRALNRIQKN